MPADPVERRLILFAVGDVECAIDVEAVGEVLPFRLAPDVDPTPAFADGLIAARHGTLPFLDLRLRLGVGTGEVRPRPRVIRLGHDEPVGLLVDDVADVVDVPVSRISRPPDLLRRFGASHVEALATLEDGKLVLILRIDSLAGGAGSAASSPAAP